MVKHFTLAQALPAKKSQRWFNCFTH